MEYKIRDIISFLDQLAPPAYQESYDNARLIAGDPDQPVKGILCSLDCTEEVIEEAVQLGVNLVVAHHPIVFKGLKSLTGKNYVERTIIKAIKNDVAIFAIHTNLDHVSHGVNKRIADRLSLLNPKIGMNGENRDIVFDCFDDSSLHVVFSREAFQTFEDNGMMGHHQINS